jgi:FdhD protein
LPAASGSADGPRIRPAGWLRLSTARCSYEIVEEAVRAGATRLATVLLPTSLAVERASAAGLGLWSLARKDSVLPVNPERR